MTWRHVLRRLGSGFLQILAVVVAVFFLLRVLPADPVGQIVGLNATPQARALASAELGLDDPILLQFRNYVGLFPEDGVQGILQGSLGESWIRSSTIAGDLRRFFPVTLELLTFSFLIASAIAIPIGIKAALRPGGLVDRATYFYSLFAGAQPEFWWGLMLIYFFYAKWGIAPAPIGRLSPLIDPPPFLTGFLTLDTVLAGDWRGFQDAAAHLILPVATLAFVLSGPIIKMVRENTASVLESDYILHAKASGLRPALLIRYVGRNSIAPTMTLIGILFGFLLGGAVLIEEVFSLGGLGQYAVRGVLSLDFPVVQGVVLLITTFSVLIYLILDFAYAVLDPRVAENQRVAGSFAAPSTHEA